MSSCLHLIVQSVRFKGGIVKPKDEIRISVTTLPSHGKDHFTVHASKLASLNHEFVINCESNMQLIILARRKSYINGDPIIGGSKFNLSSFPQDKPLETSINLQEVLTVNDKPSIQKVSGSMSIRAFFDNASSSSAPQETASPKKISFNPEPHFEPAPQALSNSNTNSTSSNQFQIRQQSSQIGLQSLPPHHSRRKSLMPKWKKNDQFVGFDDQAPLAQPFTNTT